MGRPGMQDRGGVRVRRRMDKTKAVPTDQQPFNELQELKEDPLFGWAQEDFKVRTVLWTMMVLTGYSIEL